jgi:pimeloyl-ACP methyl ester carboxylesterase
MEGPLDSHQTHEHWFSFGDCCLAVSETIPSRSFSHDEEHCLFFLHGRFGQAEMWRPLVDRLGSHFRCLRVDLPGFGRSISASGRGFTLFEQVKLVEALLERFARGDQSVIIGHDVGGVIAQLCTLQAPSRISALVLINSASLIQAPKGLTAGLFCWRARLKLKKLLGAIDELALALDQRELLSTCWRDRGRCESMTRAFAAWEYSWPGPAERQAWRQELSHLLQPVLVLWGRQDSLHPPENAAELMRLFQDAHLFEADGCGHWPCLEKLEWVHAKLREFLFHVGERRDRRRKTAF